MNVWMALVAAKGEPVKVLEADGRFTAWLARRSIAPSTRLTKDAKQRCGPLSAWRGAVGASRVQPDASGRTAAGPVETQAAKRRRGSLSIVHECPDEANPDNLDNFRSLCVLSGLYCPVSLYETGQYGQGATQWLDTLWKASRRPSLPGRLQPPSPFPVWGGVRPVGTTPPA